METIEIDIKGILNILLKRLWLIIIIPFIFVAAAVYFNFIVFVPVYQADTTLLIAGLRNVTPATEGNTGGNAASDGNGNLSYEDIVAGQTLVSEYSEIIKSKRVTGTVIKNLNDSSITEGDIGNMITIGSVNGTRIIDISVQYTDPVKAAKIADVVANVFSEEVGVLYRIENINIIDKAEVPQVPIFPSKKKNIAMTGLVGLILALGIVFGIEFLDNTFKTSEDVERHLGLNVIGSIPLNTLDKGKKK